VKEEIVVIERVRSSDLSRIASVEKQCFSDPWAPSAFRDLERNPRVQFLCARASIDQPALGYVVAWFAADEGEIANLAVAPEARGRGIGGALLDAALSHAEQLRVTAMYLEVRDSNQTARRLYESRGFSEVGRRRAYYRRPVEDAVILRRTFDSAVVNAER
jgi:[ribosomal protein S18]-alanine N-acetyltransferase